MSDKFEMDLSTESVDSTDTQDVKKKDTSKKVIIAALIAVIILLIVLLMQSCSTGDSESSSSGLTSGLYDLVYQDAEYGPYEGMSDEEIQALLNEKLALSMINISMNTNVDVAGGQAYLGIYNDTCNNYPQVVEVYVKLDGEEVLFYETSLIDVGYRVDIVDLVIDLELDQGTYEGIAYFTNVDPDSGYGMGTAAAEIKINIL